MRDWQSQSQLRWCRRYHVVFVPKYRKKVIFGRLCHGIGKIVRELFEQHGVELVEGHAMGDHVHLCVSIPPKCSVANTVGYLKGKSAIQIHRRYLGRQRNFRGFHFWARGYCVSTVGLDEAVVRAYIRNQEEEERLQADLPLGRLQPPSSDCGPYEGPSSSRPLWGRHLTSGPQWPSTKKSVPAVTYSGDATARAQCLEAQNHEDTRQNEHASQGEQASGHGVQLCIQAPYPRAGRIETDRVLGCLRGAGLFLQSDLPVFERVESLGATVESDADAHRRDGGEPRQDDEGDDQPDSLSKPEFTARRLVHVVLPKCRRRGM